MRILRSWNKADIRYRTETIFADFARNEILVERFFYRTRILWYSSDTKSAWTIVICTDTQINRYSHYKKCRKRCELKKAQVTEMQYFALKFISHFMLLESQSDWAGEQCQTVLKICEWDKVRGNVEIGTTTRQILSWKVNIQIYEDMNKTAPLTSVYSKQNSRGAIEIW